MSRNVVPTPLVDLTGEEAKEIQDCAELPAPPVLARAMAMGGKGLLGKRARPDSDDEEEDDEDEDDNADDVELDDMDRFNGEALAEVLLAEVEADMAEVEGGGLIPQVRINGRNVSWEKVKTSVRVTREFLRMGDARDTIHKWAKLARGERLSAGDDM